MGAIHQPEVVVLTYETLYEILRKEKNRDELQKIDSNFLADALNYLREKQQAYDDTLAKNDIFSQSERDKLHIQIANIKKILRDLYDLRERKIINMAINSSRIKTHILDSQHLLPPEQSLFQSIHTVLLQHRQGIVNRIIEARDVELMPVVLPPPELHTPETFESPANTSTTKHVKFLDTIEQFVGEELEMYGPYAANDEAELPRELADVLIGQGKAAEL
ncbi:DNA replication complex GINS family protein [Candidatus Woesearchaeota archaeon]|nr:MAG: DNA replication complex GINS family protein [Candidatus Woesearchaeota archaeon]